MIQSTLEALRLFHVSTAALVMVAYAVTDALYAKYTLDVANYNASKAASIGALIHFFIAFGVIHYTQNWLYIFPWRSAHRSEPFGWSNRSEKENTEMFLNLVSMKNLLRF